MEVPAKPLFGLLRERERAPRLWFKSALCAILLYGAVFVGALVLSGKAPLIAPRVQEQLVVTLLDLPPAAEPAPAPSAAPAASPSAARLAPKQTKLKPRIVEPPSTPLVEPLAAVAVKVEPVVDSKPVVDDKPAIVAPPAETSSDGKGTSGGTGSATGTGTGTATGAGTGAAAGTGRPSGGTTVLPFSDGMTRPSLLSKVDPIYTAQARAAGVEGLILTKCVITIRGELQQCKIVKGLPFMDRAVLEALAQWRYSPVLYQGKPAAVEYVIPVRLVRP